MCRLVVERNTLGRAPDNTVVVHHPSVSAHHCEILVHEPEVILRDLDSTNGTFVAGRRVEKQSPVHSGQTIQFGSVTAGIQITEAPADDTANEVTAFYAQRRHENQKSPAPQPALPLAPTMKLPPAEPTLRVTRDQRPTPPSTPNPSLLTAASAAARPWIILAVSLAILLILALVFL